MSEKIDLLDLSPYIRFVQHFKANELNYYVPWRIIYDYEMIFVTDGECVVETETEKYVVKANEIHIMKPFVRHRRYVEAGKHFNYFGVHYDLFYDKTNTDFSAHEVYELPCWSMVKNAIVDNNLLKRKTYEADGMPSNDVLKIHSIVTVTNAFENLLEVFNGECLSKNIRMRGIFLSILAEVFDEVYSAQRDININSDLIEHYMQYIMENYQHEINLTKIVTEQGISPSHFRRIFKLVTNKAPHEFLIEYRLEQAKKLFMTKKYTVTEVSYMVGYDDYHYFSRLFKNKEGVSPKGFLDKL